MNWYLTLLYMHVTFVVLSGAGFFARGVLMLRDSPFLEARWLKIAPHVNDTLLLAAAIALSVLTAQYPLAQDWLTAKVAGLVAYIVLGSFAFKKTRVPSKSVRIAAWAAALAIFAYIVSVAFAKDPRGLLAAFSPAAG